MAVRQINLLPKKDLTDDPFGKVLQFALTYGRYIIVCTQLIVLLAFFSRFSLDRELTDLQDSIDQKKAIVQALSDFENNVRIIQNRLAIVKQLKDSHDFVRSSLISVKDILPPGNTLTKLSLDEGEISLNGVSQNEKSLANLIISVNSSEHFSSVSVNQISREKDSKEIKFGLTMVLKRKTIQ